MRISVFPEEMLFFIFSSSLSFCLSTTIDTSLCVSFVHICCQLIVCCSIFSVFWLSFWMIQTFICWSILKDINLKGRKKAELIDF